MKPLIIEKQHSCVIFIETKAMTALCQIADAIEGVFPQIIIEVTHNTNAGQGSIILSRDSTEYIDQIRQLINEFNI